MTYTGTMLQNQLITWETNPRTWKLIPKRFRFRNQAKLRSPAKDSNFWWVKSKKPNLKIFKGRAAWVCPEGFRRFCQKRTPLSLKPNNHEPPNRWFFLGVPGIVQCTATVEATDHAFLAGGGNLSCFFFIPCACDFPPCNMDPYIAINGVITPTTHS